MQNLTFRSSRIIYYGPHACQNCGVIIAKMGQEFGGNAFTYPEGPIYPNSEWHPHVCDPKKVAAMPKAVPCEQPSHPPPSAFVKAQIYLPNPKASGSLSERRRARC